MRKIKKRVKIPLMTLLLAGLLGLGNYGVSYNSERKEPLKSSEVTSTVNSGDSIAQPELLHPGSPVVQTDQETGTCISVYDGDTITVRLAKSPQQSIKVRFIGIDTPELKEGEFGETARNCPCYWDRRFA